MCVRTAEIIGVCPMVDRVGCSRDLAHFQHLQSLLLVRYIDDSGIANVEPVLVGDAMVDQC